MPALVAGILLGCGNGSDSGSFVARLRPPAGWSAIDPAKHPVPGTPLAAWSGPDGATLAAFRSLPIPRPRPEALALEAANSLSNLPGVEVMAHGVVTLSDGREAARIDSLGPGDGGQFAPSGSGPPAWPDGRPIIPTYRVSIALPGPHATFWATWHGPESQRAELLRQAAALGTTLVGARD